AVEGRVKRQLFARVDGRVDPLAVEPDRPAFDQGRVECLLAAGGIDERGKVDVWPLADDGRVEVDEVGADFRQLHPEAGEIGFFEQLLQLRPRYVAAGQRHVDEVRLADELHVRRVDEAQRLRPDRLLG